MLIDINSSEAAAIADAIAHYKNVVCIDLNRDTAAEECDDCGASAGEKCNEDCNRAASELHYINLKGLLKKIES